MRRILATYRNYDHYFLIHFPSVWSTRFHVVGLAAAAVAGLVFLTAALQPISTSDVPENDITFSILLTICGLTAVAWLVLQVRDYRHLPFLRGVRHLHCLWIYFLVVSLIMSSPWAFGFGQDIAIRREILISELDVDLTSIGVNGHLGFFYWNIPIYYHWESNEWSTNRNRSGVISDFRVGKIERFVEKYAYSDWRKSDWRNFSLEGYPPQTPSGISSNLRRIIEAHGGEGSSIHRAGPILAFCAAIVIAIAAGVYGIGSLTLAPVIVGLITAVGSLYGLAIVQVRILGWSGEDSLIWSIVGLLTAFLIVALVGVRMRWVGMITRTALAIVLLGTPFLGFALNELIDYDSPLRDGMIMSLGVIVLLLLSPLIQLMLNHIRALPR